MSIRARLLLVVLLVALSLSYILLQLSNQNSSGEHPELQSASQADGEESASSLSSSEEVLVGSAESAEQEQREVAIAHIPKAMRPKLVGDEIMAYGKVLFPRAAGWEESLTVYALKKQWAYGTFSAVQEGFESGLIRESLGIEASRQEAEDWKKVKKAWRKNVLGQAPVRKDGSFELPLPAGSQRAYVLLRGRKLYMSLATELRPGSEESPTLLRASAGGYIIARISPGDEAFEEDELAGTKINVKGSLDNVDPMLLGNGTGTSVSWTVYSDATGRFELRGLPAGVTPTLNIVPRSFAPTVEKLSLMLSGEERSLIITVGRGGSVLGKVLDKEGRPIANAQVESLQTGTFFGIDDTSARTARTDSKGAFRLDHLAAGPCKLRANHDNYLESRKVGVNVPPAGQLDDVLIELATGNTLSGVVEWFNGEPAALVEVRARADMSQLVGIAALSAMRGSKARTETDAEGRWTVSGLGSGPFIVSSEAPDPTAPEGEEDPPLFRGRLENVATGTEGLLITLQPPNGLRGVAVTTDGKPLKEFDLHAVRIVEGSMGPVGLDVRDEAFNSEEGRFFLEELASGAWHIEGRAQGFLTSEPLEVSIADDGIQDGLQVVLIPAAQVMGTVVDPDGEIVEGAMIFAKKSGANILAGMTNEQAPPTVLTDETGSFTLESLPPQAMEIYADKEGFATSEPLAVALQQGQLLEEQRIVLRRGGTITGEVYDKKGKPDPGVTITAREMTTQRTRMTTSDSAGLFEIRNVVPGSYQVVALGMSQELEGEDGEFDMSSFLSGMRLDQANVVDGESVHVVLGALPENPVRIFGKITLAGEPQAGAMVSFYSRGSDLFKNMKLTTADKSGEYEVILDGAGDYIANVAQITGQPGQQNSIEYVVEIPERKEELRHNFELPLGRISGRVLDGDGQPAGNARITLTVDGGARSDSLFGGHYTELSTDAEGLYDIIGLRPGTYRLSAGGTGLLGLASAGSCGRETLTDIRLGAEQWLQDVDFRLSKPGDVEVQVLDTSGAPVAGATIYVRDANGRVLEPFSLLITDSTGICNCTGLAPGEITVTARAGDQASDESPPVRVIAGQIQKVELQVELGTTLVIKLRDAEGLDISAKVRVVDRDGREMGGMLGMQDIMKLYGGGGFSPTEHRVGPLLPGKYKVYATTDAGLSCKKNVIVRAGDPERAITLRLKN